MPLNKETKQIIEPVGGSTKIKSGCPHIVIGKVLNCILFDQDEHQDSSPPSL